ncbi:hypothetical protein [Emticicia sp. BO119]|uniref:DUF6841 family protein n=1 Tax=Emticicia sp. BO119 TaxID=2757768 RepID=UPI0015F01E72|nr:hypothetical protein [Emticicia sp. BO119]MBA4851173.1 hypothetical protein [Emticicia sp. BO119]
MAHTTQDFFKEYAAALLSFSAANITTFYKTPMAVYSDQGVQVVTKPQEVLAFWEEGLKPYAAQKITKAIPYVLTEERVSETILVCKVFWENYDDSDTQVSRETNHYILSEKDGGFSIVGLVITGA